MKKIILVFAFIGVVSAASAAEVCRIPAAISWVPGRCTAEAICTDRTLSVVQGIDYDKNDLSDAVHAACELAELGVTKALVDKGYKFETNDTLIKY